MPAPRRAGWRGSKGGAAVVCLGLREVAGLGQAGAQSLCFLYFKKRAGSKGSTVFTRIDLDVSPERNLLGLGNVSFLQWSF